jgi:deoxyribonuclease-4
MEDEVCLGFHASISGGVDKVPGRLSELDCPTGQVFLSNNRQWAVRDLKDGEVESYQEAAGDLSGPITAHACYLINLAKPEEEAWEQSVETLRKEVERADTFGIDSIVLHPGSHVGSGEEDGIARIVEGINEVLDRTSDAQTSILLETMAGQGTSLGYRVEQLAMMREGVHNHDRVAYCVDTCHMHAAGYDLSNESDYESAMEEVEDVLGLDRVPVLHLNDSREPCDSRVDRHENIGEGTIGEEGFRCLMNDPRWDGVSKVLETPVDDDWKEDYGRNLKRLVGYVDG